MPGNLFIGTGQKHTSSKKSAPTPAQNPSESNSTQNPTVTSQSDFGMSDETCPGFVPQVWKSDRCKRCFRMIEEHKEKSSDASIASKNNQYSSRPREVPETKRMSWRERVYGASAVTERKNENRPAATVESNDRKRSPSPEFEAERDSPLKRKTKMVILKAEVSVDDKPAEEVSMETTIVSETPEGSRAPSRRSESPTEDMSFRSANSEGDNSMTKAVSFESLATTLDTKSMITATSGSDRDSQRSGTPTDDKLDEGHMGSIKAQLEIMEHRCAKLENENAQLKGSQLSLNQAGVQYSPDANETIRFLEDKLESAENMCQDYRDENTVLKCELRELQESTSKNSSQEVKQLKDKLSAAESLCEELMEENENLKKEQQELQKEIEELQDQYREEEIEEFRELQRELEQTAKNCRILQFKLRKAERVKDQTEADRQHLEERIKDLAVSSSGGIQDLGDSRRVKELESELRIAKEVSVRLHNELEALEEKRCKLEDQNFYFKEKVRELETREKLIEQSRQKYEQKKGPKPPGKDSGIASPPDYNVSQLLKDLQDALERETDLRDQLKFAESDLNGSRKKLTDLETENEGLMKQLAKFTIPGPGRAGRPPMKRSYSEGQTQIQLELAEHEAAALKEKLSKIEKDSERTMSRMSLMEKELQKTGGQTEFSESEILAAAPDTYYKQKIKLLEEEVDELKLKLENQQQTEADQDLSWPIGGFGASSRRQRGGNRGRNLEQTASDLPESQQQLSAVVDSKRQLALIEQEAVVLRQRVTDLEKDNEKFVDENKKLQLLKRPPGKLETAKTTKNTAGVEKELREKMDQMQKDIDRFISRIAELEKEKEVLGKEVDRRKKLESIKVSDSSTDSSVAGRFNVRLASMGELREKVAELLKQNGDLSGSLKAERQKGVELEKQLTDYKQVIGQSDNQKVLTMATKVEVLNHQLRETQDRFQAMHQRLSGKNPDKYEDVLKEQLEKLESELAELRAKSSPIQSRKAESSDEKKQENLTAELSECNELLCVVQKQVDRVYKQLEQLETDTGSNSTTKTSPAMSRVRTAKPTPLGEDKTQILKDVAQMKNELDLLKNNLKKRNKNVAGGTAAQQDKETAQQESAAATERLLQTEERWNKELDRLRESYETQVKDLKYYLEEADRLKEEKAALLKERNSALTEKTKKVSELESRVGKQETELKTRHKDLQEKMELERRRAKEFETKYQKLEELYETDRNKLTSDREKYKSDLSDLKKKYDETQADSEKLRQTYERKQGMWQKEKTDLEARIKRLEEELSDADKKVSRKAAEMTSAETRKLMTELNQLKRKVETDAEEFKRERTSLQGVVEQKSKDVEFRLDELQRMKKDAEMLKSRIEDQKQQLEETRKARDDSREELSRWQQTWARERSELAHKLRQEGKVQQAEQQALQLKYESRIKVMEESSKRLQSQLTQTRRERDQHRDVLSVTERKLAETRQRYEAEEKETQQKMQKLEKEANEVADIKTKLEKEQLAHETLKKNFDADHRLWQIEKEQLMSKVPEVGKGKVTGSAKEKDLEKRVSEAMKVAEDLRKQVDDMKKSYDAEVNQLRKHLEKNRQESSKERSDLQRKLRESQENVKVLEIDRRNMLSNKDEGEMEKTAFISERDALMQKLHDSEIHQLANKYKLDKVADQISDLQAKIRYCESTDSEKKEMQDTARKALEQLMAVREDMARTRELGRALDQMDQEADKLSVASNGSARKSSDSSLVIPTGERLGPIGGEAEPVVKRSIKSNLTSASQGERSDDSMESSLTSSMSRSGGYLPYKARSFSSETGWESRIAEIRLRSPSPSPRKVTNYPEAPPSMILRTNKAVEYDKNGQRHWTRQTMRRSISLDPSSPSPYPFDPEESSLSSISELSRAHARSASSGSSQVYKIDRSYLTVSTDGSSEAESPKSGRKRVADIFGTLSRTREANIKDKRKLFGVRKSKSVETTDTGHRIGAMGIQTFTPAVTPDNLPESLQSSTSTLDAPAPGSLKKSGSGSKLFEKFRRNSGRSLVSTPTTSESKPETKEKPEPGKSDTSWITKGKTSAATRATSEENVGLKVLTSTSRYTTFNRLSTSYSNVRASMSTRYLNRW